MTGLDLGVEVVVLDDGNAGTAAGDDDVSLIHEVANLVDLNDMLRTGTCHDATPAATRILLDRHAFGLRASPLVLGHEGADGFPGP